MEEDELPKIDLLLEIRRNSDGELATDIWKDWGYNQYWFDAGSASCDCNRELFWLRAKGFDDNVTPKCSDGNYSIRVSNANTNEILYDEINNISCIR